MCGIAGIINHHADPEAGRIIHAMNQAQAHRGPDDSGVYLDDEVALGHRRLSIIDLTGGRQPIFNEDDTIGIVLNGEIYNYRRLREELEGRGHRFRTGTDAEVVVHLYEEFESECLPMLDGMFAFAIYNRKKRRVLLARDRLGKKPLLYFMTGDTLVFASEFSALRCHPAMPRELDHDSISDFLSLQYIPSPNTVYRNVRKLPPAHLLELHCTDGTVSIRSYWHIDYSLKQELPFRDAAHEVRRLVEKAVEKRLMSDVPCGVFLSGGLDSTIIAGVMAKLRASSGGTDAFTIGFENPAYDERRRAAEAAASINRLTGGALRHFERVVDPCDFSLLEKLLAHYGEPFADASMLPTYLLSRFARERVTVALGGDGADEVFSGYERYLAMRYAARVDLFPVALRRPFFRFLTSLLPDNGERSRVGRLRRMFAALGSSADNRYFNLLNRCPASVKRTLFGERLRNALYHDSGDTFEAIRWEMTAPDQVERCAEFDLRSYLPGDILTKVDIASMAVGLEVRAPYLDRELVEFTARLPEHYKMPGSSRKHILKAAFADQVPEVIRNGSKKGFGVPLAPWLRDAWREPAREALFDGPLIAEGYINAKPLTTLWLAHQSGRRDFSYILWNLLVLSLFLARNK